MSKRKRPSRRTPTPTGILANLAAGDYNPLERARRIAGNLMRRGWFGSRPSSCCGNYGDPGC